MSNHWLSIGDIRELLQDIVLPTSIRQFLEREGVQSFVAGKRRWYNKAQVLSLIKELKR